MSDLDVLVPTARAEAAIETLRRAGWSPRISVTPAFIRIEHAADVFAEGGSVKCDLHWHVYWECCQPDADDDLWAASVPFDFEGVPTRTLGPADKLLLVCVHGARRARRPQLQWVADSLLLLRENGIDWPRFVGEAGRRFFFARVPCSRTCATCSGHRSRTPFSNVRGVPVSRLERLDVGNRRQGLLGELPSYWCTIAGCAGVPTPRRQDSRLPAADMASRVARRGRLGALARARKVRTAFR
jgi:hypothetical protein